MEDYSYLFKIILIGDANVGKTCLVKRFAKGFFAPSQGPTIGVDFTIRTVEVDGEKVKLQVWDTAGQERFRSVTHSYYHNADGVIITYDITNRKSFENLQQHWLDDVHRFTSKKVLMYIVGNKNDLLHKREVDFRSAEKIAENEDCTAMETSAKEADNVENLFMSMATQLKRNIKSAEATETKGIATDGNPSSITLGGHNICARGPLSCCRV